MQRYKSSNKITNQTNIIFEQDFEQQSHQNPTNIKKEPDQRYKSVQSNGILKPQASRVEDNASLIRRHEYVDEMKLISKSDSAQRIRLDNFFGSRKVLQRKLQGSQQQVYNPQIRQKRQLSSIDESNQKLHKMIQKQIEDRERWAQMASHNVQQPKITELNIKEQQSQIQLEETKNNLVKQVNNSSQVINNSEPLQRVNSRQKLNKIADEKFAPVNIEKNLIFDNKEDDGDYLSPVVTLQQEEVKEQQSQITKQKKQRSVSQLKPLMKKPSTYEVLNQLNMPKKLQSMQSSIIERTQIKKPQIVHPSTFSTSKKTLNLLKTRIIGLDIKNFLQFNTSPIPKSKYIEGVLHRNKSGFDNTFFPQYKLQFDQVNVIIAKKTMKGYDIFIDEKESLIDGRKKIGSVKGNLMGSYYNVYQGEDQSKIVATVFYNSQMTTKSVAREVEIFFRSCDGESEELDYGAGMYQLSTDLKTLHSIGDNNRKIVKYINKQPVHDPKTNTYNLDFGGKVTILSVKNIILINEQNPKEKGIVFGKCGYDNFYIRAETPFTPLVVMGYLMTSFNFKLATQ